MNIRTSIIILLLLFVARAGNSQPWYFNEVYNPNNTWAVGNSIIGTESGYFGCAVSSDTDPGYYKACTFLISPSGEMTQWKCFGREGADYYVGDEGALTKCNNGFGLFGGVEDWLNDSLYGIFYKFDPYGDTLFTRYFNDDNYNVLVGRACVSTSDGGFALAGDVSVDFDFSDIAFIKVDSNGMEQWRNYLGTELDDWAKSIIQTPDNGYAIGSWSWIPYIGNDTADPVVFKIDSLGNLEWSVNLGGPFKDDNAMLCSTSDSCIMVLTAYADSMYTPEYAYARINLVKLDLSGGIIWNKKYGPSKGVNLISNIINLEDGDFVACGYANFSTYLPRAGWLFRFNSDGDSLWYRDYFYYPEDPVYGINYLYDVSQAEDDGFVAVGWANTIYPPNYVQKMWILKVDSVGCEIENCWVGIEEEDKTVGRYDGKTGGLEIWPNPCREVLSVKVLGLSSGIGYSICIYDIFGRKVQEIKITDEQIKVQINVEGYAPGIYMVVQREGQIIKGCEKFVVAR